MLFDPVVMQALLDHHKFDFTISCVPWRSFDFSVQLINDTAMQPYQTSFDFAEDHAEEPLVSYKLTYRFEIG